MDKSVVKRWNWMIQLLDFIIFRVAKMWKRKIFLINHSKKSWYFSGQSKNIIYKFWKFKQQMYRTFMWLTHYKLLFSIIINIYKLLLYVFWIWWLIIMKYKTCLGWFISENINLKKLLYFCELTCQIQKQYRNEGNVKN